MVKIKHKIYKCKLIIKVPKHVTIIVLWIGKITTKWG
jgi:hypothetical protein